MTTKINILHVDDSQRIISVIKEALDRMPNVGTTQSARTFESGKKIIDTNTIDLAILDIQLPDGNGIELLRWIKEKHPRTRVIILSNHTDGCHRAISRISGADFFFDKSMEFDQVALAIELLNKINNN